MVLQNTETKAKKENGFILIMLDKFPEQLRGFFDQEGETYPLPYFFYDGGLDKKVALKVELDALIKGILVVYPQGPPEVDVEEFRKNSRRILDELTNYLGYNDVQELILKKAVELFDDHGADPSTMAMITAGMIKSHGEIDSEE